MLPPLLLWVFALFLSLSPAGCQGGEAESRPAPRPTNRPSALHSVKSWQSLRQGGRTRRYLLFVPQDLKKDERRPLVLLFHGAGSKPETILRSSGFDKLAVRERFFLAVPEGTPRHPRRRTRFFGNPRTWNDGSGRASLGAFQQKVDDVGFVRNLIADLRRRFPIDPKGVYASGFSNGASLTFRLGRELGDTLAAIAPVAGADFAKKSPKLPLPSLFYITGLKDPLNPFEGGPIKILGKPMGTKAPVLEQLAHWRKALHLPKKPRLLEHKGPLRVLSWAAPTGPAPAQPARPAPAQPARTAPAHAPGQARSRPSHPSAEIRLLTIQGQGHIWPGSRSLLPKILVGTRNPAIDKLDLAQRIWAFFRAHPRP
ncbi:MAG TPA: hypothetical protein ENK02_07265 [Planctomycetes bacterium]|nr:hypothetical protein [Planctomycetota bacterium]